MLASGGDSDGGGAVADLTNRQRAILEFITRTHKERGYPPSVREIGEAVGLQSPSSVHAQLATLAERGYLRKDPTRPRAIVVQLDETGIPQQTSAVASVPLIGQIAAGSPILATEQIEETLPLPQDLVGTGTLFALRVKGDSMINAGIFDGDTVVIRQQKTADDGTIIAALVDGEEATVKRLSRKGGRVRLLAENPAYEPIEPDDVQVLGKVVAVLRSL
ncbi:MAG TPA: transcriptional repressor LexA [Actinomycetota bacterium]|nr:transcriptional repressor LexA [Actinomycetota bacterium]